MLNILYICGHCALFRDKYPDLLKFSQFYYSFLYFNHNMVLLLIIINFLFLMAETYKFSIVPLFEFYRVFALFNPQIITILSTEFLPSLQFYKVNTSGRLHLFKSLLTFFTTYICFVYEIHCTTNSHTRHTGHLLRFKVYL